MRRQMTQTDRHENTKLRSIIGRNEGAHAIAGSQDGEIERMSDGPTVVMRAVPGEHHVGLRKIG